MLEIISNIIKSKLNKKVVHTIYCTKLTKRYVGIFLYLTLFFVPKFCVNILECIKSKMISRYNLMYYIER